MLKKKKYPAYVSNYNSNPEKQVILLTISIREKCEWSETLAMQAKSEGHIPKSKGHWWQYLALKKLLALLRRII